MTISKIFHSIIIIIFILSSHGCDNNETNNTKKDEILTSSKTIGSSGGEVFLEYSGKKATAVFPENTLGSEERIVLKRQTYLPAPLETEVVQAGDCINFSPEGLIFNKKVTLGIPFYERFADSGSKIGIKYYDPILGSWTEVDVKKVDSSKNIVYFETDHFSNYIAYIEEKLPYYPEHQLAEGEYFTGAPYYYTKPDGTKELRVKGCINRQELMCAEPWHLSIFLYQGNQLIKIVDRFFTLNHLSGYHAELSEDGSYVTFDTWEMFPKVKESGDARLWDWQCEFVKEQTKLLNYRVYSDDDPQYVQDEAGEKIYAEIMAIDEKHVKIQWQINIVPEIKPAKALSIRFEARYNP